MQSSQQVNLYTEEFRPRRTVLPLSQILGLALVLVVVLTGLTFWLQADVSHKEMQAQASMDKAQAMQVELQKLAEKVGLLKQDESLVRNNQKLRSQIRAREQMLAGLGTVALRDSSGFSPYLIGLARQKVDLLWLQRISIADAGNSLQLEGRARKADLVPAYLRKLNDESVFSGHAFSVFDLSTSKDRPRDIGFVLKSKNEQGAYLVAGSSSARSSDVMGGSDGRP